MHRFEFSCQICGMHFIKKFFRLRSLRNYSNTFDHTC